MDLPAYLGFIADQLANELKPILNMPYVTNNSELLGAYTEAVVRNLIRRIVHPMHVCTGVVLDHPIPQKLIQVDVIIWAPYPVPAIFAVEGFGLVPRSSAFGVLEIKRSNYGAEEKLEEFSAEVDSGVLVCSPALLSEHDPYSGKPFSSGVAVVCVLEKTPSAQLRLLIDANRVAAIIQNDGDKARVRKKDLFVLVNFLHFVTWRYRAQASCPQFPQIGLENM
jgi:hypothetical protein